MEPDDLLEFSEIAEMLGVARKSAVAYHHTAERNRREGKVRPTDMPAPDYRIGRTPVWKRETIEQWMESRTPRVRAEMTA